MNDQQDWIQELLEVRPSGFDPLVSTHYEEDGNLQHGSWDAWDDREHADQRSILPNEVVIDIDADTTEECIEETQKSVEVLDEKDIPYIIADTGGTGFHVHVFFRISDFDLKEYRGARQALYALLKDELDEAGVDVDQLDDGMAQFDEINSKGHLVRPIGGRKPDTGRRKTVVDSVSKADVEDLDAVDYPDAVDVMNISREGFIDTPFELEDLEEKAAEIQREKRKQRKENYESTYEPDDDGLNALRQIPADEVLRALEHDVERGDRVCCPCHDDSTPSADVTDDGQLKCWGACGTPGQPEYLNAIDIVMEVRDYEFPAAKEWLMETFDVEAADVSADRPDPTTFFIEMESGRQKFIPKLLGDHLRDQYCFLTARDNETMYVYRDGYYQLGGARKVKEKANRLLQTYSTKSRINETIYNIEAETGVDRDQLGGPDHLVNVKNGLLDLEEHELQEHSPEYLFTTQLPVEYDPDADCPHFNEFLQETLYDEDIATVQELFGYCLIRDTRFEKAFMFTGDGGNGKSTLLHVLEEFLGPGNTSSELLQDLVSNRFRAAELYGKLANIAADLPSERLRGTGKFKMFVSGDPVTGERKNQDPFKFENYAKLIFSANTLPETPDDTRSFFRRWIIVSFPYTFSSDPNPDDPMEKEKDPDLEEKLTTDEELSGILNWALDGLERLLENGGFSHTRSTDVVREQYTKLSDPIKAFAQDRLLPSEETTEKHAAKHFVEKRDAYREYQQYCEREGLDVQPYNQFCRKLPQHVDTAEPGQRRINGEKKRVWNFVRWRPQSAVTNEIIDVAVEQDDVQAAVAVAADQLVDADIEEDDQELIVDAIATEFDEWAADLVEERLEEKVAARENVDDDDDEDESDDDGPDDGTEQQGSSGEYTSSGDTDEDTSAVETGDSGALQDDDESSEQGTSSEDVEMVQVKMTENLPKFMGVDLEDYGPFDEGDEALLPAANAENLIDRDAAEPLDATSIGGDYDLSELPQLLKEHGDGQGVDINDVHEYFQERGHDEARIKDAISTSKSQGETFEPRSGRLKAL